MTYSQFFLNHSKIIIFFFDYLNTSIHSVFSFSLNSSIQGLFSFLKIALFIHILFTCISCRWCFCQSWNWASCYRHTFPMLQMAQRAQCSCPQYHNAEPGRTGTWLLPVGGSMCTRYQSSPGCWGRKRCHQSTKPGTHHGHVSPGYEVKKRLVNWKLLKDHSKVESAAKLVERRTLERSCKIWV